MHMKWEDKGMKTPLARAKGLGSSRSAVDHWIGLRVSAIANVILLVWFVWFVKASIGLDHAEFSAHLAQPLNAVAMILFTISVCYHSANGAREIIEDYIHCELFKVIKLVGLYLVHYALAAACVFAVLKVAL